MWTTHSLGHKVMTELLKLSLMVSWDDVSVEGYELVAIMYQTR